MEYFAQFVKHSKSSDEGLEKLKSSSSGDAGTEINTSSSFDCNICLDIVRDPVVTFCGHLYCWPCIYRWMQSERSSENFDLQRQPQCPVCKAQVTQNTLIPLYGRGQSREQPDQTGGKIDLVIPHRPSGPCGVHTIITAASTRPHPSQQLNYHGYSHPRHHQVHPLYSDEHSRSPTLGFAGTTTYNPMIDIFGEMIYDRMFGNSQTTLYTCPNTYSVATMSSPRLRRHVMQVDRSLSRVSFFLLCCVIVCLFLF